MKQLATLAAFAIIGALVGAQSRESTPPPALSEPREEVIHSQDAAGPGTPAPLEEPPVWYSNYNAACNVALETGRPLIVAVTEEKPEFEPTAGMVFCWLHPASAGPEWDRFNPPCVLRSDSMTPVFNPINLEDL